MGSPGVGPNSMADNTHKDHVTPIKKTLQRLPPISLGIKFLPINRNYMSDSCLFSDLISYQSPVCPYPSLLSVLRTHQTDSCFRKPVPAVVSAYYTPPQVCAGLVPSWYSHLKYHLLGTKWLNFSIIVYHLIPIILFCFLDIPCHNLKFSSPYLGLLTYVISHN